MVCILKNDYLTVAVNTLGAQLQEISTNDWTQYLWKGDKKYWEDSAPVLFPYIGRLYNGAYTLDGCTYKMGIHGFAAQSQFMPDNVTDTSVTMVLRDNDATLMQYPFHFTFSVTYSISKTTLSVSYNVKNNDDKVMPFALGGHPGFNVPFIKDTSFEDYYLEFDKKCKPDRIGFTENVLVSGDNKPYPLQGDIAIDLRHDLFDEDAVILQNMARSVSLKCKKSGKGLLLSYPDMPYLGIWHMPKTDAPYVCIEPWTSLPSREGITEEFYCKSDMIRLNPGESYNNGWSLTALEE